MRYFSSSHRQFIQFLFEKIRQYYGGFLISLAVFGSYARSEQRLNSDIDLFIVLDNSKGSRRRERQEEFVKNVESSLEEEKLLLLEESIFMEVSTLILNVQEAQSFMPLYLDMTEYCEIIFDRNHFLERKLSEVRGKMKRWGSCRKQVGGHWYWEVRPGLRWNEVIDYDQ